MFHLCTSSDTVGVTTMDEIEVAPASIVRRFGPPANSDGCKISGEFVFCNQQNEPFVVHDWKSTSLWERGLPTPEEFWASDEPREFSIASRDQATEEFIKWFFEQL